MYRLLDLQKKMCALIGYLLNDMAFALLSRHSSRCHDGFVLVNNSFLFSARSASFGPQLL